MYDQVAILDQDEGLIYSNQAFQSFIKLYSEDLSDSVDRSLISWPGKELSGLGESIQQCLETNNIVQSLLTVGPMGHPSYYKVIITPLHESNQSSKIILTMYNVSEVELKKQQLSHQIEFHTSMVRQLPLGIFTFDKMNGDYSFSHWNPKMEEYFGYSEAEVLGKSCNLIFPKETIKDFFLLWSKQPEKDYLEIDAYRIRTEKGDRHYHTIISQSDNDENSVESFLCMVEDVTEKIQKDLEIKQYQEQLKDNLKLKSDELDSRNAEISSILKNSYGLSIFSLDRQLRYRFFNRHHKQFVHEHFGISINVGDPVSPELLEMNDGRSFFTDLVRQAMGNKNIINQMHYVLSPKVSIHWDGVFSPILSGNEVIGTTIILFDTAEIKESQHTAHVFKSVADNADYGVILTNLAFDIIYANRSFYTLIGRDKDHNESLNMIALFNENDLNKVLQSITDEKGTDREGQVEVYFNEEGETGKSVLLNYVPYRDIKNNIVGISFTCIDITLLKQAQEAMKKAKENAERSSLLKSSFVANMSHEIRTPLNSILGFSELLNAKLDSPELKSYLTNIISSGRLLKGLINDILDFSKIEAGKMSYKPTLNDTEPFFKSLYEQFSVIARKKGIYFNISSSGPIPRTLEFDAIRLNQVLNNLLSNAIKFTPWGFVLVRVDYIDSLDHLKIIVKDSGIGIDKEGLRDIFNPFEQQEKADSRSYEGTGLGLAITRKLVNMMGGRIDVKSGLGQGCKFSTTIPVKNVIDKESQTFQFHYSYDKDPLWNMGFKCLMDPSITDERLLRKAKAYRLELIPYDGNSDFDHNFVLVKDQNSSSIPREGNPIILTGALKYVKLVEHQTFSIPMSYPPEYTVVILKSIMIFCERNQTKIKLDPSVLSPEEKLSILAHIQEGNIKGLRESIPPLRKCIVSNGKIIDDFSFALKTYNIEKIKSISRQLQEILEN